MICDTKELQIQNLIKVIIDAYHIDKHDSNTLNKFEEWLEVFQEDEIDHFYHDNMGFLDYMDHYKYTWEHIFNQNTVFYK